MKRAKLRPFSRAAIARTRKELKREMELFFPEPPAITISASALPADEQFCEAAKVHDQYLSAVEQQLAQLNFLYSESIRKHPRDDRVDDPRLARKLLHDKSYLIQKRLEAYIQLLACKTALGLVAVNEKAISVDAETAAERYKTDVKTAFNLRMAKELEERERKLITAAGNGNGHNGYYKH